MFDSRIRPLLGRTARTRVIGIAAALAANVPAIGAAGADIARVAVAANFTATAKEIGAAFTAASGHEAQFSFGATGQLYAQISQGAPFGVFLAADREGPARAESEGLAVPGTRFTYATGAIVLFSADPDLVAGEGTLGEGRFTKLAIANPATAPYGHAAVEAMKSLGVYEALRERLVRGNSIAQAYQFVDTGNAELGFVALSQVVNTDRGSRWLVPARLYPVIAQDAVLLEPGRNAPAARAFLDFLRGDAARKIKAKYGYGDGS